MHGSSSWYSLVVGQWYSLVHFYSGISHSDSVAVIPSFYFYFKVARRGKDKWLYPPLGCSLLLVIARDLRSWSFPQVVA